MLCFKYAHRHGGDSIFEGKSALECLKINLSVKTR